MSDHGSDPNSKSSFILSDSSAKHILRPGSEFNKNHYFQQKMYDKGEEKSDIFFIIARFTFQFKLKPSSSSIIHS